MKIKYLINDFIDYEVNKLLVNINSVKYILKLN